MCRFSFSSQPLCVLDTAGCKAVAANPKVLLLSWACKLSAIEIPVGAFGCSCVKTLSGFVVIERVCLELCSVVWVWFGSHKGVRGAWKMWTAPWFCRNRHGGRRLIVPCFCRRYQPHCLCLLTSSLHPPLSLAPNQLYQHDKSMWNTGVTTLLPFPTHSPCLSAGLSHLDAGNHHCSVCIYKTHPHSFSQPYLQTLHAWAGSATSLLVWKTSLWPVLCCIVKMPACNTRHSLSLTVNCCTMLRLMITSFYYFPGDPLVLWYLGVVSGR